MRRNQNKLKHEWMQWLVVLTLVGALALSSCARNRYYYDSLPCEIMVCTDYSSGDDAYLNGVMNEICGMDCKE